VFAILNAEDDPHKMDNENLEGTEMRWVDDIADEIPDPPKEDIYKEKKVPPPTEKKKPKPTSGKTAYW